MNMPVGKSMSPAHVCRDNKERIAMTISLSLPQRLKQSAQLYSSKPAFCGGGRSLLYEEFARAAGRIAAGLAERGLKKGDRVGLYCVNSSSFALAYFGILKAGCAVVPINLLLNPKEAAFILNDAGAAAIVYHEAFAPALPLIRESCPSIGFAVCIGTRKAAEADLPFNELLESQAPEPDISFQPEEDLAVILYTSGTTGRPKGAMLTHRNLISDADSVIEALKLAPGTETFLVVLPMFHAFAATAGMIVPLLSGSAIAPVPKFDPVQVADAIAATRATIFLGVPSMYNLFLRMPVENVPKLASLKFCVSGGAALPVEIMARFEEVFGKKIYEGDGPTECSPVTCVNPIGGRRKPGSVGLAIPGVQMRISDESGRELPHGQVGEICVRGPNVMKGYWNLPGETREAFFGDWFRTGDLGTEDDERYFCIVDRKKDMIIVNGMNVYPRIVEELLYKFEPVCECAVVGEPHELHGEIPVAYVALKKGRTATEAEIRAYCRESLGKHEVPRKVYFMAELPKNAAGKIVKRALRKHGEAERGIRG